MDKRHYELMYIIPITYAGEALQPLVESINAKIKEVHGDITREHNLGKRKFAYPIKHNHQGFYFLVEFNMNSSEILTLEKWLKLKREVLRYLLIKKDPGVKDVLDVDPEGFMKGDGDDEVVQEAPVVVEVPESVAAEVDKKEAKGVDLESLDKKLDELMEESV
jgi:small subunit ribosomal protein S6